MPVEAIGHLYNNRKAPDKLEQRTALRRDAIVSPAQQREVAEVDRPLVVTCAGVENATSLAGSSQRRRRLYSGQLQMFLQLFLKNIVLLYASLMTGIPYVPLTEEQIFASFWGALPAWALLVVAPRWPVSHRAAALSATVYSTVYVGLLAGLLVETGGELDLMAMSTLSGVQSVLADKRATLLVCDFRVVMNLERPSSSSCREPVVKP